MNKKTLRIGFPVIVLCISLILVSSNAKATPDMTPVTSQNLSILQLHNIILKRPSAKPAISDSKAIEIASLFAPGMASTAKSIIAEYQLMTNKGAKLLPDAAVQKNAQLKKDGFLNDTPVYIVTFKGISKKGHDGMEGKQPTTFTESNVIVDATTGEVIASYYYR